MKKNINPFDKEREDLKNYPDVWVEWLCKNPELAEEYYPKTTANLKDRITNTPDYLYATIIQRLPDQLPVWKKEVEQLFGKTREKKIAQYIELIDLALNAERDPRAIIQQAVQSVYSELTEQLEYWLSQLGKSQDTKTKLTSDNYPDKLSTKQKVENAFAFMKESDPRQHVNILEDEDYRNLINCVTYYFENGFSVPKIDRPIQNVNTSKGNIVFTFKRLFKRENPTKTFPDSLFFLIIACFHEYRDDSISNLKKTKKPQYYEDLIINN